MPIPEGLRRKFSPPAPQPVKSGVPDDWLGAEVDEGISFVMESKPGVLHVSNLGDDARVLVLRFLGLLKEHIPAHNARAMGTGTAIHGRWEKDLRQAGLLVAAEKNVVPLPGLEVLRGRLDFIVKSRKLVSGPLFLLELKTRNPYGFGQTEVPDYNALAQWSFYSYREEIPNGYIIYEEPGTQAQKYFQMWREGTTVEIYRKGTKIAEWPNLLDLLVEKVRYVLFCAQNGKFPERCAGCVAGCRFPGLCGPREEQTISLAEWRKPSGIPEVVGV